MIAGASQPHADSDRVASVLAITSQLPWPLDSGGHIRTFHLLRALAGRFRLRLVTAAQARHSEGVEALRRCGIQLDPVDSGPRGGALEVARAALTVLRREPFVLYRRHERLAVRADLRTRIRDDPPDLLYFDHLDPYVYRDLCPDVPAVIDCHNVYSSLTDRTALEQRWAPVRYYLHREARLLARSEERAARDAIGLFAVSEQDRNHFEAIGARAISLIPNGVDCAAYQGLPLGRSECDPIILYIGSMRWEPNVLAARWLAGDLLPRIQARIPSVRLRIVGRDPGPDVRVLGRLRGVEVVGAVPDVLPHLAEAALLAVPLESGGGTRLKILEAFAAGLPVVSTPIGCEGLGVVHAEHLMMADRVAFAHHVAALLEDRDMGRRIAAKARSLVLERYDWGPIGQAACTAITSALSSIRAPIRLDGRRASPEAVGLGGLD